MAITLKDIQAPIKDELKHFEKHFKKAMSSPVPLLDKITNHILRRKGKQIRPLFVFLTAGMAGNICETSYHAASLVELLHTATLVHDDVVDDSDERRGFFSIQALWGKKIAVLVGDYLLSRGLLLALDNNAYQLLHILSTAVREMSEGELLQIQKARRLDITEEVYFDVIRQKTASLIAAACSAGVASVCNDDEKIKIAHNLGQEVGIAFQIKDDLLDFGGGDIGKPQGVDIKEKKMTLPLIYALSNTDQTNKRRILRLIKNAHKDNNNVRQVIDFIYKSGGIDYANKKMHEHLSKARTLMNHFDDNECKISLNQLLNFVTERKK